MMDKINDVLGTAILKKNLDMQLGLNSQLQAMFVAQSNSINSLNGLNMMNAITKSMKLQNLYTQSSYSVIDTVTKSIGLKSKFIIPRSTLETISLINRHHDQLFGKIRGLTESLRVQQSAFPLMNNWQFAIGSISSQIAGISAHKNKWDLLEDFEIITEEAVAINERIIDSDGITRESLDEIVSLLQRIEIRVDKIDKDARDYFWKFLTLLSFIFSVLGEARNWQEKPHYVTRLEVETVFKKQFSLMENKLKEVNTYKTTNRKCKVMIKPTNKTMISEILPINFKVVVIHVHHKWTYVSYLSKKDKSPHAGWILKKYLD